MPTSNDVLTDDERAVLKVWREASDFATVTLNKHQGKFVHGEVTRKIKPEIREVEKAPPGRGP